jgi:LytS/YehU family sensor histidine kinase
MTINRYNQLQKEKAQTELSFLKAQINPHFLFNSINSIFASIDKNNIEARSIVIKFSDMLRYQLYECNADQINFEKEFEYLNNYIELQRIRKDNNLTITTDLKGDLKGFTIAPLILIPFIENAFKYSSNHVDQPNVLQMIFTKEDAAFGFYCFNTKDQMISRKIFEEGGIGIQNVKRRLELIYPGRHALDINDNELFFEVRLKIEL